MARIRAIVQAVRRVVECAFTFRLSFILKPNSNMFSFPATSEIFESISSNSLETYIHSSLPGQILAFVPGRVRSSMVQPFEHHKLHICKSCSCPPGGGR